jgi:hypothetical protein
VRWGTYCPGVSISLERRELPVALLWTARVAASFFLIIGALVSVTFLETGEWWTLGIAVAALGGALFFIFGLERPHHAAARWARPVGWFLMALASTVPSSFLFIPFFLVLLALPAVLMRHRHRDA